MREGGGKIKAPERNLRTVLYVLLRGCGTLSQCRGVLLKDSNQDRNVIRFAFQKEPLAAMGRKG